MGCSPSKGKLFSKQDGLEPHKTLLTEPTQVTGDCRHGLGGEVEVEENECLGTDEKENELPLPTEEHPAKDTEWSQLTSNTAAQITEGSKGLEENVVTQEIVTEVIQSDKIKKTEKRKKNKGKRRAAEKLRKSSFNQTKVDLPPLMVRAHQAAYAFLNPNISKYETLLGLLDQAAQTQLSLQPMMSALVLRFEEINQALEEMAEEGELVLKEHGDYMALPSGMMGPAVMPAKSIIDKSNSSDAPPDLLQQMLQHSTEKMKLVGGSVQALGDTTLEEAAEYFSSLSKVLVEKLRAKQVAERRVAVVLARVEGAAMRTSNPEDSALHSEDSGIGGENESLTGRPRKSGLLLLSETVNSNEGGLVINGNNNNNSWPDGRDDLDVDNLPPPPPEVLMDNSFRSTEATPGNEEGSQEHSVQSLPMINHRNGVSQRLRASVQNVEVLPNRASVRPKSMSVSSAHPVRQDAVKGAHDAEQQPDTDMDPELEKANCLYQQARKIIHLRNAAESLDKKTNAERRGRAPPVSRVRLPPSCPSVRQRFPSPPVFRPQSTSSRPSSPRTVVRATDNNTEEIVPLVSFRDARSVFCRNESQSSSGRSWGEVSRGRLSTRGTDGSIRRTQSEQRPTSTSNPQFSKDCSSGSTQAKESELLPSSHRPGSPLRTEDNIQSDTSAAV
ncbi:hypothetical protein INR49_004230 [Caranx melampygus]|nr:hypothetical protein INR49_004230 [Caranx melampygus]